MEVCSTKLKDYKKKINSLMKEIENRILSTENWIYYFWDHYDIRRFILSGHNYQGQECKLKVRDMCSDYIFVDVVTPDGIGSSYVLRLDEFEEFIEKNVGKKQKDILSDKMTELKQKREAQLRILEKIEGEIAVVEDKLKEENDEAGK